MELARAAPQPLNHKYTSAADAHSGPVVFFPAFGFGGFDTMPSHGWYTGVVGVGERRELRMFDRPDNLIVIFLLMA